MLNFIERLQSLVARRKDERGASAVEYGLLVAAIAALIVIIVFVLGGVVKDSFDDTCDTIKGKGTKTETNCADS